MTHIYVPCEEVNIETVAVDGAYYHKVWAQITDDLQITMDLDLQHIGRITDYDLRETYADDTYPDSVRDAIETLIREVWFKGVDGAEARIKSYKDTHLTNLICKLPEGEN